jgi:hypothetical protein
MFYAAFSFYPFVSIRACHAEALAKAGDSRAEKSSQAATIFAYSSTGDADFCTARDLRKCREDSCQSAKGRIRRGE